VTGEGADRSANAVRAAVGKGNAKFGVSVENVDLVPPDSVVGDPARRRRLEDASIKVVEITAILGAVTRAIPGPAGKVAAFVLAGLEKSPETGRVRPTPGTAGNFLPSPIGFMDPEAVGLPRNFYLPAGSTEFIPRAVDRVGLGLPQQRAEDEVRRATIDRQSADERARRAAEVVQGESVETLEDLAAGRGGLTRAGVLIATSETTLPDLQAAAQRELSRLPSGFVLIDRAIAAAQAERGQGGAVQQATAVDELFRANPPDP